MLRLITLIFLTVLALSSAESCAPMEPCRFGDNAEYRTYPPPEWDGKTPIGLFIFVHGHRSSAAEMMNYRELAEAVHQLGFMLVAPQGMMDSWSTPGSPGEGRRDDVRFMGAVLDDLQKRFPVDKKRIITSGFSQGASIVWELACKGDGRFTAFLPIAGVWWQPMPSECPAPRRPMLHIHGTSDPVMPMSGRNLQGRWRQGNVVEAFATMKRLNTCPPLPTRQEKRGTLACDFYEGCGSAEPQALCLHEGDHHINPVWLLAIRDWLEATFARN